MRRVSEPSTGELVKELADEVRTLLRQEMRLAKLEVGEKGRRLGSGAIVLAAAGFLAFFAFAAATVTAILALSIVMSPLWASLIVAGGYALTAGILALVGVARLRRIGPPVPEETLASVKEDVRWARTHLRSVKR